MRKFILIMLMLGGFVAANADIKSCQNYVTNNIYGTVTITPYKNYPNENLVTTVMSYDPNSLAYNPANGTCSVKIVTSSWISIDNTNPIYNGTATTTRTWQDTGTQTK